jgi:hypothetical protein
MATRAGPYALQILIWYGGPGTPATISALQGILPVSAVTGITGYRGTRLRFLTVGARISG